MVDNQAEVQVYLVVSNMILIAVGFPDQERWVIAIYGPCCGRIRTRVKLGEGIHHRHNLNTSGRRSRSICRMGIRIPGASSGLHIGCGVVAESGFMGKYSHQVLGLPGGLTPRI